jgi:GDP-4-dehydro-6-deoxy-D-mannose reductase
MHILVTGITGFAGGYLAEELSRRPDLHVVGLARRAQWSPELRHLERRIELVKCDLCSVESTESLLQRIKPAQLYHLAGYAHSGRSSREPDAAWEGNLLATRRLYEAVSRWGGNPRILYVGSGLVYGDLRAEDPGHNELSPLLPNSPYSASKCAADLTSYQVTRDPGLEVIRVRPFNHVGPRQSPDYAIASFTRQISRIERNSHGHVLEVGNLAPVRDLTDVRDMARAYISLMEHGRAGEVYNAASGISVSMHEVVSRLAAMARVPVKVEVSPRLVRPVETWCTRGDSSKLRQETGWAPAIPLEQTLADTLEYWRSQP